MSTRYRVDQLLEGVAAVGVEFDHIRQLDAIDLIDECHLVDEGERVEDAAGKIVPALAERVPVIMVRIGYAEAPTARSLRLPLEAVFETVDPKPDGREARTSEPPAKPCV